LAYFDPGVVFVNFFMLRQPFLQASLHRAIFPAQGEIRVFAQLLVYGVSIRSANSAYPQKWIFSFVDFSYDS
jgi:hypothetical protein